MEYFVLCMTTKFADFDDRARPAEYWMFFLFSIIFAVVFLIVWLALHAINDALGLIGFIIYIIYVLAIFIPSISAAVRRLHDTNRSGWFYLINFIPLVGPIILIVLLALEGTRGPNTYGPDPLGQQ